VNEWVEKKTQGRIKQLIEDEVVQDPLTIALLINAVFFKGSWADQFDPEDTRPATFQSHGLGAMPCQMMCKRGLSCQYTETASATSVALPYMGGSVRAIFILPNLDAAGSIDPAAACSWCLGGGGQGIGWKDLVPTQVGRGKVTLSLPRFKMSFGVEDLSSHLQAMGLQCCIKNGTGQFLRMSSDPEVHIDAVLHKAVVEVNEEGTVAAAATAVVMMTRCLPPPEKMITFDRPFIFAIEHVASGELLFIGVVASPELS
jgi:serpin B